MLARKDMNDLYQLFIVIQQNQLSGIPITDALRLYEQQSKRPKVKKILAAILRDMGGGMRMPDAFAKHPDFFPGYIVEMMRVNEGTGQAKDIYEDIVKTLEQALDLRRNVSSQMGMMIFLGIVLVATIGAVFFIVLPYSGKFMQDLHLEVPWLMQLLIDLGDWAQGYWYLILAALALAVFGIRFLARKLPERTALFLLKMPLYGPLAYYMLQYRFALVFGLCKAAGLDTIKSLQYTQKGSSNVLMEKLIKATLKDMAQNGSNFVAALESHNEDKALDESFYMFLRAGEQGDMAALMRMRVDFYKKQLIIASKQFSSNLENFIHTPIYVILILVVFLVWWPFFNIMMKMPSGGMSM